MATPPNLAESRTVNPEPLPSGTTLAEFSWSRRRFLTCALGLGACAPAFLLGSESKPKFRAAIIGHTGRGNYGHEHELIFNGRESIEVVAVADPDPVGRAKAAGRCQARRQYADYRQMLKKERPNLVCVAPRWTDQHHAMAMAALAIGAHVYLEKPITQTLVEADELVASAKSSGVKIAVAHQMRLAPNLLALQAALQRGWLGELLEMHSHGKQDHRSGGEDLVVLGVHVFDLMRYFAGSPRWCSARVLQDGHEITPADAHAATENIGPVAGDEVMAQFAFGRGVQATFTSRSKNREAAGPWGLELVGTKGTVRIHLEMIPEIYRLQPGKWSGAGKTDAWVLWEQDPTSNLTEAKRGFGPANGRVVDDWLAAIREDREPVCSGVSGLNALEMVMGVFAAGLARGRVEFPLEERQHPLAGQPVGPPTAK